MIFKKLRDKSPRNKTKKHKANKPSEKVGVKTPSKSEADKEQDMDDERLGASSKALGILGK